MKKKSKGKLKLVPSPIRRIKPKEDSCFDIVDSSKLRIPATMLLKGDLPRDPQGISARLANLFIAQNKGILNSFGTTAELAYDGQHVDLVFTTGTKVGAIPLLSPTSGKADYGLVIKPRFGWSGLGMMLGEMGWKVLPTLLKLPLLPRSDRKVPPWVLSTVILASFKVLLNNLVRKFDFCDAELPAPRGNVNWLQYANTKITAGKFLEVPCRYPDLSEDHELKAAIHFTLLKQLASLQSQRTAGVAVLKLITICQSLLEQVRHIPPKQPAARLLDFWYRVPYKNEVFRDGIQTMEWAIEERGLAGLADQQGLPWVMCMEQFFEAWLETVVTGVSKKIGGIVRVGRKMETVTSLNWEPPYYGSQKYILPDIVLERESETIIFDAKYKGHWEELNHTKWGDIDSIIKESHRADLLQVLAYSTAFNTQRIISCLVYPCRTQTWESLQNRNRVYHRASLYAGTRRVEVVLAAVPMESNIEGALQHLARELSCVN